MGWKNNHQPNGRRRRAPSGFVHSWRLWRHCCCRYGWYPLLVAPIVTAGTIMSLYSTVGCDFIRVSVGFSPSNPAWNQSSIDLGVIQYQSGLAEDDRYMAALLDGCRPYKSDFDEMFIDDDRTWAVAKIMSYIAGGAGMVATAMIWFFVITPLPAFFFWPGMLLPSLMIAFLAEGSKFLFFDTAICRNTIWFPSGADSLPRVAESCELGTSGYFAIAGGTIYFLCLIIVCLMAPEKRELLENYGDLDQGDTESELAEVMERGQSSEGFTKNGGGGGKDGHCAAENGIYRQNCRTECRDDVDDGMLQPNRSFSSHSDRGSQTGQEITIPVTQKLHDHHRSNLVARPRSGLDAQTASMSRSVEYDDVTKPFDDVSVAARLKALDSNDKTVSTTPSKTSSNDGPLKKTPKKTVAIGGDDGGQLKKPALSLSSTGSNQESQVSESRVNAIEKLEVNTGAESDALIEQFVADLNRSFNADTAPFGTTNILGGGGGGSSISSSSIDRGNDLNSVPSGGQQQKQSSGQSLPQSQAKSQRDADDEEGSDGEERKAGPSTPINTYFQTLCTGIPPSAGSF